MVVSYAASALKTAQFPVVGCAAYTLKTVQGSVVSFQWLVSSE